VNDVETEIHGTCAERFEPVREAFAANFAERGEIGASVAVAAAGETVVNLWAGWADPARSREWQPDTLTNVWSTTKAMTSLCAHVLMDRGELDPDAPVARYWPERLISAKTLEAARTSQGRHTDLVLGLPLELGLGFGLSGPEGHFGPNPASFGHDGFGGSAVGADPEAGLAFAYVMNRMGLNLVDDPRKMALVSAIYQSLGAA
jgi:CubicO group peptidase (beta-lactamase class C family)